jgi:hypothetical protein
MSRFALSLVVLVALANALPACSTSSNPSLEDVTKQYSAAYCQALERCRGTASFSSTYSSQSACAAQAISITDTSEKSLCSQDQWSQCFDDFAKSACCLITDAGTDAGCVAQPPATDGGVYPENAPSSRPKIPDSCQGC